MDAKDYGLWIAGQWRHGGGRERMRRLDPSTDVELGGLWCAGEADVDDALEAARAAFPAWRARPAVERAALLHQVAAALRARADDFAQAIAVELGNVLPAARMEAMVAADVFDWSAGEARRIYGRVIPSRFPATRQLALKEPIGPVYAACPWNMPLIFPARKIAEALAAGCTVVIKPAEETPGPAVLLAEVLQSCGLPSGVVNLVFGNPAMVSQRALGSGVIRKLSFTGSVPVGKVLARLAADRLVKCTLELGGHAPTIVFADADIARCAALLAERKARVSGQVCNSPTRFYVQRAAHARFRDALASAMEAVRIGHPLESGTQMGPLVNARRRESIEGFVADALAAGAELAAGGSRLPGAGQFHALTLLDQVPDSARIMREEPFGSVAAMQVFDEPEEVIAKANALPFGLAAYVFSSSQPVLQMMTERLEVGLLGLNGCNLAAAETPFGGIKESGYGSEGGSEGVEGFLHTRFVSEEAVPPAG